MVDRLKEILARVQAWWNKFTTRQKSVIIGIAAAVVLAFAIIIYVASRPDYTRLIICESATQASEVTSILDGAGIKYELDRDGLQIDVQTKDLARANIAMGSAGYVPEGYSYNSIMSGGLTSTSTDANRRYKELLEAKFSSDLAALENVSAATVRLNIPEQDGTILRQQLESSASVTLTVDRSFTSVHAANVARMIATALGNDTTSNITIVDQNGNMLFIGGDDYNQSGIAESIQELQDQAEEMVANRVKDVLYGTNQYNDVRVTIHLPVDYGNYEKTIKEYWLAEGREQGPLAHEEYFEGDTTSGVEGDPGTTSNDEDALQTNVWKEGSDGISHSMEFERDYLPSETITHILTDSGAINYNEGSIGVSAVQYRYIYEADVRARGLLDDSGLTWEEYKYQNSDDIKLEVDEDFLKLVANASGVPVSSVTIVAYATPIFVDEEGFSVSATTVGSVFLFILIIALLAFVVLRTMLLKRAVEEGEEEELSVEGLLQSTPEQELEEIDVESKSEARRIVEKFVDENPESAAALLRNWLNEDWA